MTVVVTDWCVNGGGVVLVTVTVWCCVCLFGCGVQ